MPDWLNGLLGAGSSALGNYFSTQQAIAQAQINAQTIQQQQAYMASLAQTSAVTAAGNTKTYMIYGVGLLVLLIALRQTRQA